jgi:hypothetical protein
MCHGQDYSPVVVLRRLMIHLLAAPAVIYPALAHALAATTGAIITD